MAETLIESTERTKQSELTAIERHFADEQIYFDSLVDEIEDQASPEIVAVWANDSKHYTTTKSTYNAVKNRVKRQNTLLPISELQEQINQEVSSILHNEYINSQLEAEMRATMQSTASVEVFVSLIQPSLQELRRIRPNVYVPRNTFTKHDIYQHAQDFLDRTGGKDAEVLGSEIGRIFLPSEIDDRSLGRRVAARNMFTRSAKKLFKIENRDDFRRINNPEFADELATQEPIKRTMFAYLQAINYDRPDGINHGKELLDRIAATSRMTRDPEYLKEIKDSLNNEEITEDLIDRTSPEKLIALGLETLFETLSSAAQFSQNARGISGHIKNLKSARDFSYASLISLANQFGQSLNSSSTLPEGISLPELNTTNIGDLPIAIGRIHYVVTETGQTTLNEDKKKDIEDLISIAKILTAAGAEKKSQEQPMSIGDVVLEFPDKTASELQEIIELLESGVDVDSVHEEYRSHNHRTGGRAFWRKFQAGYGIIS